MIYFDSAATTLKPQRVIDVIAHFYKHDYATVNRGAYEKSLAVTQRYADVRSQVARFIGADDPSQIVFTKGTTESINLVATSFGKRLGPGDEVVISEMEHHSNIVPWQLMCQERGATLRVIPMNDRGELGEYQLSKKTKIVSIAHISNVTGAINPVKQLVSDAHAVGAVVLVDGAQAAGHMSIDVRDLDADFYAFSGHKMYGPTGIGVLYGKKELLESMPPYQGGGDMVETVTFEKTTYQAAPLKFEAGTPPIAQVIGLGEAIRYLEEERIDGYEEALTRYTLDCLEGVRLIGEPKERGSIITFVIEGAHPMDVGMLLDAQGIAIRTGHLCAQPALRRFGVGAACRISFGLSNKKEEVDFFIIALEKVTSKLFASSP